MSRGLVNRFIRFVLNNDLIVEQGTSGIWTYRKWKSGIAECWGYDTFSVTISSVATYYHRGKITNIALPSGLFYSITDAQVTNYTSTYWASIEGLSTTKISNLHVYDVVNGTASVGFTFHLSGRWKA